MTERVLRIDYDSLARNALSIKRTVGDYYCVLKCDAYGHGAKGCAQALYDVGMRRFAVFSLAEALEIKPCVKASEVLILGRTPAAYVDELKANGFVQTVFSEEYARELFPFLNGMRIHIKLDTGMNRSGFKCEPKETVMPFLGAAGAIEGVYTHFHCADGEDLSVTESQLEMFESKSERLETLLSKKLVKHASASAAALRLPKARLDLCRIGLALYGCLPDRCEGLCELTPVMSLTAPIISVRNVKKGENIGYGCDHQASRAMTVATAAVGYANGLSRSSERLFRPLINGERVSFAGRICMDRCMLDVTGLNVKPYDTVELFGGSIPVNELSLAEGTISYETLTRVGRMNSK